MWTRALRRARIPVYGCPSMERPDRAYAIGRLLPQVVLNVSPKPAVFSSPDARPHAFLYNT